MSSLARRFGGMADRNRREVDKRRIEISQSVERFIVVSLQLIDKFGMLAM